MLETDARFIFLFRLQQRGYASLAEISTVALTLRTDPEEDPKTEVSLSSSPALSDSNPKLTSLVLILQVEISHVKLRITACADSIVTLGALAGDLSKLAPSS